jgi:hypothetical protein
MADCKHTDLEWVGEQKTEEGVNSYYRCKACSEVLVVTPQRKVFGLKPPP